MKKQTKKLGNPAALVASSYLAQNPKAVGKAVNIGMILVGISVLTIGGFAFHQLYWKHRFRKMKPNANYAPSSVTPSEAKIKAEAIYRALHGFPNDFDAVYEAMKGVNYNGFVAIYNAFGKRPPADKIGIGNQNDLTLTEWLKDLRDGQIEKLRNLTKIKGLF